MWTKLKKILKFIGYLYIMSIWAGIIVGAVLGQSGNTLAAVILFSIFGGPLILFGLFVMGFWIWVELVEGEEL